MGKAERSRWKGLTFKQNDWWWQTGTRRSAKKDWWGKKQCFYALGRKFKDIEY